jgi:hypothetical protein
MSGKIEAFAGSKKAKVWEYVNPRAKA